MLKARFEGAFDESERLFRRAVELGYQGNAIFTDPDLESLRGDPRFEALVERVRSRRDGG